MIENNFWDFDKNLIYLYVLFLLEYEGTNGFLSFYRNHMYWKNLILELQSKNLQTNQNSGFFKLQYLRNELRYEVEFLYVIRHP